jgi:hypothetical protein
LPTGYWRGYLEENVKRREITEEVVAFIDTSWNEWQDFSLWHELYNNVLDLLDKFENGQTLTEEEIDWILFTHDDLMYNN